MSEGLTPKVREIFSVLKTEILNVDFMLGDYVMDSYKPVVDSNGLFKPYVLCKIHTSYEHGDNGICEKSKDPLQGSISFYVVSPDAWVTSEVADKIRVALRGRSLEDTGPITLSGGYSFSDSDLGYIRYAQNVGVIFQYNLGGW